MKLPLPLAASLLAGLLGAMLLAGCTAEVIAPTSNSDSPGNSPPDNSGNTGDGGNGGGTTGGSTAPTVVISASPATVSAGGSSTLTWSSSNATSCAASGGWGGDKSISGSESLSNITSTTAYTLTCTGAAGSANQSVTVVIRNSNPPATVPNPADLVFFDNFEYDARRDDANVVSVFQQHGWAGAKTEQTRRSGGWIYTVNQIPGYNGAFPGGASNRVLAIEARPDLAGGQTDFYLGYGNPEESTSDGAVPGNVWFQFWFYINYYGDQISQFDRANKFIYPCNSAYPCNNHKWLLMLQTGSSLPYGQSLTPPTQGQLFFENLVNKGNDPANPVAVVVNEGAPEGPWNYGKLGHTNNADFFPMTPNRWMLIKIHLDTSTPSGVYETWIRTVNGPWVKVIEWIDGVTPGFTWRIQSGFVGGHRGFRMPTTMGAIVGERWASWMYMDDFAMARSESGLPVY